MATLSDSFSNYLVIYGLPTVPAKHEGRLSRALFKTILDQSTVKSIRFHPDGSGMLKAFAFLEMISEGVAKDLIQKLDGYQWDEHHTVHVATFDEMDLLYETSTVQPIPEVPAYAQAPAPFDWMKTEAIDSQLLCFSVEKNVGPVTGIVKVSVSGDFSCDQIFHRVNMCDGLVNWSVSGGYFSTLHAQGAVIWGTVFQPAHKTSAVERVARLSHPSVEKIIWSPGERWVATVGKEAVLIWDLFDDATCMAQFSADTQIIWSPSASSGCAFFCAMSAEVFSVHRIDADGSVHQVTRLSHPVSLAEWCPSLVSGRMLLAYAVPEEDNTPARIVIWSTTASNSNMMKAKTLFLLKSCRFVWHPFGLFLLVIASRWANKQRKATNSSLEVIRLADRDCPSEAAELGPDCVLEAAWDLLPGSSKFALLRRDSSFAVAGITKLQIWECSPTELVLRGSFDRRSALDQLSWSPRGQFLLAASQRSGAFEIWDGGDRSLVASGEHIGATEFAWDPSGLLISSAAVEQPRDGSMPTTSSYDCALWLWNILGQPVLKRAISRLGVIKWRPRPLREFISADSVKKIVSNYSEWATRFDAEDHREEREVEAREAERCRAIREAWQSWRGIWGKRAVALSEKRALLCGNLPLANQSLITVEEVIEEVIEETQVRV